MLKTENTNVSMSGSVQEGDTNIAHISSSYSGNNEFYISININDYHTAYANKETLFADITNFMTQMFETIIDIKD